MKPVSVAQSVVYHFSFPGLKPGDCWCLCAARWQEALEDGVAPTVVLEATHARALEACNLADLQKHRVIRNEENG